MRHAGRIVTRTMLLENVWEFHFDPQTTVVETHISRLRSKIDQGFSKPLLHTVRGSGYCIREDASIHSHERLPSSCPLCGSLRRIHRHALWYRLLDDDECTARASSTVSPERDGFV